MQENIEAPKGEIGWGFEHRVTPTSSNALRSTEVKFIDFTDSWTPHPINLHHRPAALTSWANPEKTLKPHLQINPILDVSGLKGGKLDVFVWGYMQLTHSHT